MNIPYFKKIPPKTVIISLALLLPVIYYTCLVLTQNEFIYLFQILFFFFPSLLFFNFYQIQNATSKQNLIRNVLVTILATLILTFILNYSLDYWFKLFPPPKELEEAFNDIMRVNQPMGLARDLLVLALIPAICEEFFFRGFLQTSLSVYLKPRTAIIATSLFFALFHANPWLLPYYIILGLLFGILYEKSNNIITAILAHFINNTYGIVLYHTVGEIYQRH